MFQELRTAEMNAQSIALVCFDPVSAAAGIPEAAVVVDDLGVDTRASARNTASILRAGEMKSVLVITQYFHIPRCRLALSQLGVAPVFHAHARYFEARDL